MKFKILILATLGVANNNFAQTNWVKGGNNAIGGAPIFGTSLAWNSPVYFHTFGQHRATLFNNVGSNGGSGNGAFAINSNPFGPITAPTSLFNIGESTFFGQQPWMRVGMSTGFDNDMAYFGLKNEGADRNDAIIAWGNDATGAYGPDVLRFHHTSTQSELARFAPNGGNGFGNFYLFGINTQPVRRMELLDANPNTGTNANAPQLRLTYAYNANPILGIFSEFQTTSNGDLFFNTRTGPGSANARSFGFHKFNPLNTVEIAAQLTSPYLPTGATGSSGLRFTSLTSAKTTVPNGVNGVNSLKVLTVDSNGDVVLTDANSIPNTNCGITTTAGIIQLGLDCSSTIFDKIANGLTTNRTVNLNGKNLIFADGGRVGIGKNLASCTVGNKLEVMSGTGMPYYTGIGGGTNGSSGLRLTFLPASKTPVANGINGLNYKKALSVDDNGDVVLIENNDLGNICGSLTPNPLLTNWEIPLNSRNFIFSNTTAGTTGRVGIGLITPACTPGNLLEVNKGTTSAISGLRLTDLATAIPLAATTKVLSVDANGDVIVTTAPIGGGGASLGNLCSVVPVPLLGNYQIEMAGNNFNYTMPALSSAQVNIGLPVCATNPTRLFVTNDFYTTGAAVISNLSSASSIIGLHAQSQNTGSGNVIAVNAVALGSGLSGIGVNSESNASSTQQNIAINGNAKNGTLFSMAANLDVIGSASPLNQGINTEVIGGTNATATSFGINSTVSNIGSANYGGYFSASNATNNYGIYAQAGPLTPSGSIPPGPNYAGYFNGDVVRTGSDNFTSDAMLKQNIDTITNAMGIINLLKPKTYDYKLSIFPSMHLPSGKQYGLIAQDVQTILPELVNTNVHPAVLDSLGAVVTPSVSYLSLEYQQLTAIMIKAMQQQQVQIHKQDSLITALTAQINSCCTNASARTSNPTINSLDVDLSDKDVIVLNQNVPNPFAEQTTITYNVPASVTKAQILFFNNIGQVIQTVDIKTRGMGKVNVFASDLSAGLYNYSLVADGKVIDSKKMVRE